MSLSTSPRERATASQADSFSLSVAADMPSESLLFATLDLEQANEQISKVYTAYRYSTSGAAGAPACMYNLPGQAVGLSKFSYGTEIAIEPEPFDDFLLVLTTLSGHSDIATRGVHGHGGAGTTVLVTPGQNSSYHYDAENSQFVTRINAQRIVDLAAMMGGSHVKGFPLASQVISNPRQLAIWRASLQQLRIILDPANSAAVREMLLPRAEELLILTLLGGQVVPQAASNRMVNPGYLRRAVAYIEEHAEQPMSMADIANASHCGIRTLHRAFHDWRGISPMRYLKEVRLHNVHQALRNPTLGDSVTSIALRWGFLHLGQFALDYKNAFGEKPSQTLRRAQ